MNTWDDTAIILNARAHGENGVIVNVFTEAYGRHMGYVPGGQSRSKRMGVEPGCIVQARWQSRVLDQMGTFVLEPIRNPGALIMDDGVKLAALASACALCDTALPEREAHPALYHGLTELMTQLSGDLWGPAYVAWEIAFMREMGYALDFSRCAAGGDVNDLIYISPKSGVAVSRAAGAIYKAKLLELPEFLKRSPDMDAFGEMPDVERGLRLTGHFLEHWVFNHHRTGVPEARLQLMARVERACDRAADVA